MSSRKLGPLLIGLAGLEVSPEERDWLCRQEVGGVVLFTRNFQDLDQLSDLTASINVLAGRELLICVDHEGGRVQRFKDGFTRLPSLAMLGDLHRQSATHAQDFAYRHGRVMATELLLCGVDLSFAPVLDVGGRSVVIGDRAFSVDPDVIIELAGAYIAGMHDAGMAATGKHFPGHGSVEADSHTDDVCDQRNFTEIEELDIRPFSALGSKLDAMMMAHVLYPAIDSKPAGYSAYWIKDVLRRQLQFAGTIFSDDLGMFAAEVAGGLLQRVQDSLSAGCDAVLVCDPQDVRQLLACNLADFKDADTALRKLKGRVTYSREDVERVGEWRQWKKTIEQLEQSKWG